MLCFQVLEERYPGGVKFSGLEVPASWRLSLEIFNKGKQSESEIQKRLVVANKQSDSAAETALFLLRCLVHYVLSKQKLRSVSMASSTGSVRGRLSEVVRLTPARCQEIRLFLTKYLC